MESEFDQVRYVLRLVEIVAATDAMALLLGESGAGKDLIARAIHERSPRRKRLFVTFDCAAIPSSLFESEFFGHEPTGGRMPCNQSSIRRNQRVIVSARRDRQTGAMTSKSSSQLVAIVDGDQSVRSALKDLMESVGVSARRFRSAEEFLARESTERSHD